MEEEKLERNRGEKKSPERGAEEEVRVLTPGVGALKTEGTTPVPDVCQFLAEGEKCGPSREYLPALSEYNSPGVLAEDFQFLSGKSLGAMGGLLMKLMDVCQFDQTLHSKPQPSGKDCKSVFPLPWSADIVQKSAQPALASATCRALNLLYGAEDGEKRGSLSAATVRALKFVVRCVETACNWGATFEDIGFDIFFRSKGVDYRGEEVKVAQRFSWSSISPALPPEVGSVELKDFCTLGTKFYIERFEDFLVPPEKRWLGRTPTVMALDDDWAEICEGLVKSQVCGVIPLEQVCHVNGRPMLGGLFGVGKGEFINNVETQRLIMNFVPLNQNCRPFDSDIATLPGISGLSPFLLEDGEFALISSEDIRCFFYLFALPTSWFPFLAFSKPVPDHLVPEAWKGKTCMLRAKVLPMGFRNSVGIAQHVHRQVIRQALHQASPTVQGEGEMRKDRAAPQNKDIFRIYLDNFDVISKVDPELREKLEGKPGLMSLIARQAYTDANLPRHPKKSVCQAIKAEVQGAIFDGEQGVAYPKPPKIALYISLALELLRRGEATQREMQVVCGGFVYFCMFRRPLLAALNGVWRFIEGFKGLPPVIRSAIPWDVRTELIRFIALIPLARMDFRLACMGDVTASDASSTGGGACVSSGLTDYGLAASNSRVRGDIPEPHDFIQVLSVGLFDGVGCLRLACDLLGLPMAGHISVEKDPAGRRVVEAAFGDTLFYEDVALITEDTVDVWVEKFGQVGLILLGAGPPCQGVSGLNADKRGALKDERSCLFQHVPRVRGLLKAKFPWAQVRTLMESVASMDEIDKAVMSEAIGSVPFKVDASGMTLAHRPRLYWCDWELLQMEGVEMELLEQPVWGQHHQVNLSADIKPELYIEAGWQLQDPQQRFPTFTTSRPSPVPGRRPAGIKQCRPHELDRWSAHHHRFPPYQYKDSNCLVHRRQHHLRIPSLLEREVIMGMPANYTSSCSPKSHRQEPGYSDTRLTLVGNAWSVPIVTWLVGCLTHLLGLSPLMTPQCIVRAAAPGSAGELQKLLVRPPVNRRKTVAEDHGVCLVKKLSGLVSIKGEDLLLKAETDPQIKHQRLRASLPSGLWRWRTIAGWSWQGTPEHINVLELRAIYTSIRWWAVQRGAHSVRLVHLTDSLVCLHSLSRGRSSSRKMRRTMAKLNSYLLVCNLHPVWAYVHTSDNPADKPSRRRVKKRWVK